MNRCVLLDLALLTTSYSRKQPSWAQKNGEIEHKVETKLGDRFILFVLGGITYSEIREIQSMAAEQERDITISEFPFLVSAKFIISNILQLRVVCSRPKYFFPRLSLLPLINKISSCGQLCPPIAHWDIYLLHLFLLRGCF